MPAQILYATFYGSTKQYADALADRLGVTAQEITASVNLAGEADPVIVLSPIHGPTHPGVKFVKGLEEQVIKDRRIALVTVGMTLDEVVQETDPAKSLLGSRSDAVTRFYLPGRLNYSELNLKHRSIMKGLISMLKMSPGKSANEQMMIDTYGSDVDRVDLARLDPIVEWARSGEA